MALAAGDDGNHSPAEHVVFLHGWLGSRLALPSNPQHLIWSDDLRVIARSLAFERDLLDANTVLIPIGLNQNYETFVNLLGFMGFHNLDKWNRSEYVYDWRQGVDTASCGLNSHLDKVPKGTVIVAHSFGGLVALFGIASGEVTEENLAKISKLVLIATPFLGTTFALLGLAKSGDFVRRAADFFPPFVKVFWTAINVGADPITDWLAPVFGGFQSLYDMIPHDLDVDDLKVIRGPKSPAPVTSQFWPFWNANLDAKAMRQEARRVQAIIRDHTYPMPVISIYSDTEDTPHRCMTSDKSPFALGQIRHVGDVKGDGIVAASCTYPAAHGNGYKLNWSDRLDSPTSHNLLLRHKRTDAFLRELLT